MDPTRTISYRRWRNKMAGKSFFGTVPTAGGSGKPGKQQLYPKGEGDELEMQRLVKELEQEYRKSDLFRQEKVAEFKRLIKLELYHVSGKAIVEKWFPQFPESEYR
jgi:hypothetical protein